MATVRDGNRAALLVVDLQVGVVADAWDAQRIAANAALAVERARAQGAPVIWVQHANDEFPSGSPQWQWVSELAPVEGETRIEKRFNSAFEQTSLEAELERLGASHVVLAGAQTNWCIRATAYAALERGYDLTLLDDAHTTSDMTLRNGSCVAAASVVNDLNIAMTWLEYPGRTNRTASAGAIDFCSGPDRTSD